MNDTLSYFFKKKEEELNWTILNLTAPRIVARAFIQSNDVCVAF